MTDTSLALNLLYTLTLFVLISLGWWRLVELLMGE